MVKIFVMVPELYTDKIISAMAACGAGVIGKYTHNAVITKVTGNWKNEEGTKPFLGEVGKISREPENKVEMVCPEDRLIEVMDALYAVHPYEEPAVDIISLVDYKRKK